MSRWKVWGKLKGAFLAPFLLPDCSHIYEKTRVSNEKVERFLQHLYDRLDSQDQLGGNMNPTLGEKGGSLISSSSFS